MMTYVTKKSFRIVYSHMISDSIHSYYSNSQVSEANFVRQIKWYKKHFKIISLEEALARAESKYSLDGYLSITIDDGFRECYDIIAPILLQEKTTATFFLITDCIDNKKLMWRNKLLYLINSVPGDIIIKFLSANPTISPSKNLLADSMKWGVNNNDKYSDFLWDNLVNISQDEWLDLNKPYMTTKQILELLDIGFSIGSHTKSHPICDNLDYKDFEEEVVDSVSFLEREFSTKILSFAYPFGSRAKKEYETKLLNNTDLKMILGVRDSFGNKSNPSEWERIGMENKNAQSIFFFRPLRQYLKKNLIKM